MERSTTWCSALQGYEEDTEIGDCPPEVSHCSPVFTTYYLALRILAGHSANNLEGLLVLFGVEGLEAECEAEAGPVAVALDDGALLGLEGRLWLSAASPRPAPTESVCGGHC